MKWQFVDKKVNEAALHLLQRRRERAGHVQGPPADGAQPAPAHRGVRDRLLRHRLEGGLHLHPRRVPPRPAHPRGGDRRGLQGRLPRARTSSAPASTATSTCIAAPAPTRPARRPRSSNRSKASARSRASSRRFPAVEGLYGCPTAVNNVETLCNVPPIIAQRRGVVRVARAREERRARSCTASAATSTSPASSKTSMHMTVRELIYDYAGGIAERTAAEGGDSRRHLGADPAAGSDRHAGELRRRDEGRRRCSARPA